MKKIILSLGILLPLSLYTNTPSDADYKKSVSIDKRNLIFKQILNNTQTLVTQIQTQKLHRSTRKKALRQIDLAQKKLSPEIQKELNPYITIIKDESGTFEKKRILQKANPKNAERAFINLTYKINELNAKYAEETVTLASQAIQDAIAETESIITDATSLINQAQLDLSNKQISAAQASKIIETQYKRMATAEQILREITKNEEERVVNNDSIVGYFTSFMNSVYNFGSQALAPLRSGYGYSDQEKEIASLIIDELEEALQIENHGYAQALKNQQLSASDKANITKKHQAYITDITNELYKQKLITGQIMSTNRKIFWTTVGAALVVAAAISHNQNNAQLRQLQEQHEQNEVYWEIPNQEKLDKSSPSSLVPSVVNAYYYPEKGAPESDEILTEYSTPSQEEAIQPVSEQNQEIHNIFPTEPTQDFIGNEPQKATPTAFDTEYEQYVNDFQQYQPSPDIAESTHIPGSRPPHATIPIPPVEHTPLTAEEEKIQADELNNYRRQMEFRIYDPQPTNNEMPTATEGQQQEDSHSLESDVPVEQLPLTLETRIEQDEPEFDSIPETTPDEQIVTMPSNETISYIEPAILETEIKNAPQEELPSSFTEELAETPDSLNQEHLSRLERSPAEVDREIASESTDSMFPGASYDQLSPDQTRAILEQGQQDNSHSLESDVPVEQLPLTLENRIEQDEPEFDSISEITPDEQIVNVPSNETMSYIEPAILEPEIKNESQEEFASLPTQEFAEIPDSLNPEHPSRLELPEELKVVPEEVTREITSDFTERMFPGISYDQLSPDKKIAVLEQGQQKLLQDLQEIDNLSQEDLENLGDIPVTISREIYNNLSSLKDQAQQELQRPEVEMATQQEAPVFLPDNDDEMIQ